MTTYGRPGIAEEKACTKCGAVKPLDDFYYRATATDGRRSACKACELEKCLDRYHATNQKDHRRALMQESPERRAGHRRAMLKHKFGITPEEFDAMSIVQGGICLICHQEPNDSLCIDHDRQCCPDLRSCGKCIRALLCRRCNAVLGLITENTELLKHMAEYIDTWHSLRADMQTQGAML